MQPVDYCFKRGCERRVKWVCSEQSCSSAVCRAHFEDIEECPFYLECTEEATKTNATADDQLVLDESNVSNLEPHTQQKNFRLALLKVKPSFITGS